MKKTKTKERLLKLADFLEKLPRKRFNYGVWVGRDWKGKQDLSCGTKACAFGWATQIPAFHRAGLKLVAYPSAAGSYVGDVMYDGREGVEAASDFFDIDVDDATELFIPNSDADAKATPKQVAKKIRQFVERLE